MTSPHLQGQRTANGLVRTHHADVVFCIDRVMHYHLPMLTAVERGLEANNLSFAVLSSRDDETAIGRVASKEKAVKDHSYFRLSERLVGGFMLRYQHGLLREIKARNPLVIVSNCHSGTATEWFTLLYQRIRGARNVAWQCGYEYNPGLIKDMVLSRFIPLFDSHLCYHSNAKSYAMRYGAREDQTIVMHNTIDESRITPMSRVAARRELEQRYPQLADKRIVLHVGAVLAEKRIEQILDALELLGREDVSFVLVGDGPHLPALKDRYGQRRDWITTGRVVDGVGIFFDAADVFVLPGTGGLAINEAMAHRLPVIAGYADGSADDLVLDGQTGYRLHSSDPEKLAELIGRVLSSPEESVRMGLAAEQRIRGPLSFQSFIQRVVDTLVSQAALARR